MGQGRSARVAAAAQAIHGVFEPGRFLLFPMTGWCDGQDPKSGSESAEEIATSSAKHGIADGNCPPPAHVTSDSPGIASLRSSPSKKSHPPPVAPAHFPPPVLSFLFLSFPQTKDLDLLGCCCDCCLLSILPRGGSPPRCLIPLYISLSLARRVPSFSARHHSGDLHTARRSELVCERRCPSTSVVLLPLPTLLDCHN